VFGKLDLPVVQLGSPGFSRAKARFVQESYMLDPLPFTWQFAVLAGEKSEPIILNLKFGIVPSTSFPGSLADEVEYIHFTVSTSEFFSTVLSGKNFPPN